MKFPALLPAALALCCAHAGAREQAARLPYPVPAEPMRAADSLSCSRPAYPLAALRDERTGTVTMQFLIGIDGKVKKAKLIKSSGSPDLDDAAMSALQLCRFTPGKLDGQPAEAWTIVQYVWTLEDPPPAAAKADTQRE